MIGNLGPTFVLAFLFICFLILLVALGAFSKYSERVRVWVETIRRKVFWNTPLRFIFEVYLEVAVASFVKLQFLAEYGINLSNVSDMIDFVTFLACFAIAFTTPLFLAIFVYLKRERFNEERYREKYDSIYEGIDLESKHAVYYMLVFTARRLFYAFVIVFLPNKPSLQIQLALFMPILVIIFLGVTETYGRKSFKQRHELANEVCVLFMSYFLPLFTDFVPEPLTRHQIGWGWIFSITLMLVLNMIVVLVIARLELKKYCRDRKRENRI